MSLLPEPSTFEKRYSDDEKLASELPDRPITSLRDLQYVYGRLYTLATAGGGEYAAYLTPEKSTDLFDEPESLLYLRVDLSGDKPRLDPDQPIGVESYGEEKVEAVAHSWYNAAKGFDHSVTHRTGKNKEPEKVAEYLHERLTAWAADDVIQEAVADHEDGWIVDALAELGESEGLRERIETAVEEQLDGKTTALTTVAVKLEPDGEYLLPGEASSVFNEAMRARKRSKLVSKGEATDSIGEATDLVTGNRGPTVGTAEDPLNYFLGKQLEKFPGFDPDEAWRTHPVSEDVAVTLMNASTFVDACDYYTMGANVYYLPYFFGRLGPADARDLYGLLYDLVHAGEMSPLESAYRSYQDTPRLQEVGERFRFYVAAVMEHQTKRFDVFGDSMDGTLFSPVELTRAHQRVLQSWLYDAEGDADHPGPGLRAVFPTPDNWDIFVPEESALLSILATGWYFEQTFAPADDDDASADDYRIRALVAVLSGEPLDVEMVLTEYVERLLEDEGEEFPSFRVSAQYAQLCALAEAGLLTGRDAYEPVTEPRQLTHNHTDDMQQDTPARADGGNVAAARETKLEQFLEQTPALAEDQPERRGSFLLGALVGQVTGYQQVSEGRSTTLIDQYPIKAVTESKLKRLASDVLDKNVIYSRENNMSGTMYREVVDRLVTTLPRIDIDGDWELDTTDLRFYYSLGVAYGMNNWASSDDEQADDQPETEEEEA
ncbi:CRISPR-associated protein Csh1 (plasmid) [Halobacterium sp. DL1]|jgi:CRISPR-associated protein Cas8b/Csh1 subtype I-B|uniref:type I-B CRISPR-associated protein Cas8b/Csh1 n=1 Tax=Halorubrum lacusprofundi TaxID=2247 RepID=UPI00022E4BC9|nr:type I-B CRISPR-associated protein Cas8b/Csh1 [Halorubrum lacusprofundi]AHG05445.1 CRISPR-associated protein Csh1 [Halobacterium sp. DL1]MCG1007721.1 type I-B CRISPR-associated protein Cas8b/Csh1 [Halorubrum lacusprofundi]